MYCLCVCVCSYKCTLLARWGLSLRDSNIDGNPSHESILPSLQCIIIIIVRRVLWHSIGTVELRQTRSSALFTCYQSFGPHTGTSPSDLRLLPVTLDVTSLDRPIGIAFLYQDLPNPGLRFQNSPDSPCRHDGSRNLNIRRIGNLPAKSTRFTKVGCNYMHNRVQTSSLTDTASLYI